MLKGSHTLCTHKDGRTKLQLLEQILVGFYVTLHGAFTDTLEHLQTVTKDAKMEILFFFIKS